MAFGGHKTLTHLTLQGNDQNDMLPPLCEVLRNPKCNLKYLRYISLTITESAQPVNRLAQTSMAMLCKLEGAGIPYSDWIESEKLND